MRIHKEEIDYVKILEMKDRDLEIEEVFKRIEISPALANFIQKNKWIEIPNKNLWFNKEIMGCYPNFNKDFQNLYFDHVPSYEEACKILENNKEYSKYKIKWDLQTYIEGENSFCKTHPMESHSKNHMIQGQDAFLCKSNGGVTAYYNGERTTKADHGLLIPIFRILSQEYYESLETTEAVFNFSSLVIVKAFIGKGLNPHMNEELDEEYKSIFRETIMQWKYIKEISKFKEAESGEEGQIFIQLLDEGKREIVRNSKIEFGLKNGDRVELSFGKSKNYADGKYIYSDGEIEICRFELDENKNYSKVGIGESTTRDGKKKYYLYRDGSGKDITEVYKLLKVDNDRVNLPIYDESLLTDPNKGDWDIYDDSHMVQTLEDKMGEKIYGRDPHLDVKKDGIVGIDFGTKSTVVVFQDANTDKLPMRMSGEDSDNIGGKGAGSQYENPTAIEFENINSFMKAYRQREGRPLTKWKDIRVSHAAFHLDEIEDGFYSNIPDLKQWASNKGEKRVIRDKNGMEIVLPPYLNLEDGDLDPIEIYAYYIGSYINNMKNGIYTEYYLSFPVNYDKKIRDRIIESFKRGIKKSFPQVLLEDREFMSKFIVRFSASEPAAYAVCALQEYGFKPERDENIYYGVFDFGGGTTDFDFGIWKRSAKTDRYDYELQHFGAGCHEVLGGENILKELAFDVFRDNLEILKENSIYFYRPSWCANFEEEDLYTEESSEAKFNIKIVMEKLRPIWENREENEKLDNKISVNLYMKNQEIKNGVELSINREELEKKIRDRIAEGVRNFFISMKEAMRNEEVDRLNIFLGGNSSKHPEVMKQFLDEIEKSKIEMELFPPLGTKEADIKCEQRGIELEAEKIRPTGKTGVAYGILDTIADRRIKVINLDEENNIGRKQNFRFFVGDEKDSKLSVVLHPITPYEVYIKLGECKSDLYTIFYTTLPEAITDKMDIEKVKFKRVKLNMSYPGAAIYIKSVDTDRVAYAVTNEGIEEKNYLESGEIVLE